LFDFGKGTTIKAIMYADCAINRPEYINVWGIFVILHSYEETKSELDLW